MTCDLLNVGGILRAAHESSSLRVIVSYRHIATLHRLLSYQLLPRDVIVIAAATATATAAAACNSRIDVVLSLSDVI